MSRKDFKAIAQAKGGMGKLVLGEDGTVLYSAYDVITGKPVTVCLFYETDSYLSLENAFSDFSNVMRNRDQKPDLTPADKDFQSILNDLKKPGKLH